MMRATLRLAHTKQVKFPSSFIKYRGYHDSALEWAQKNPAIAQACLDLPPMPNTSAPSEISLFADLTDYWNWRKWEFACSSNDLPHAQAVVSHVLSAPLTLASQLCKTLGDAPNQRWCCIGARAEASLPLDYWKEMLIAGEYYNQSPIHIQLDFIGPDMKQAETKELSVGASSLQLRWLYCGKLHDYIVSTQDSSPYWDVCILLNPGFGHKNLKNDWKPTLDLLFKDGTVTDTLLLTAHSKIDAERDASLLEDFAGKLPSYSENPFASRIAYQDPFDSRHLVRPNHYVITLRLELL